MQKYARTGKIRNMLWANIDMALGTPDLNTNPV